tara:strand:- start:60105 stop:60977 length:873 start_codon:yes stop_codon:yes gene_type:complete
MVTPGCAVFGLSTLALGAGAAYLLHRKQKHQTPQPMRFALGTAAVFAMQTFNVTVIPDASSGHLIGGYLLASWFGPLYALLGLAMVLATQSLLFADGGLAMWGLNSVLMGVIPGVLVFSLVKQFAGKKSDTMLARAAGSWLSVFGAGLFCSLCVMSRPEAREQAVTWMSTMVGVHALIGIVEAIVTVSLLTAVERIAKLNWSMTMQTAVSCIAMAGIVIAASFGASPYPDGLEYSLEHLGLTTATIENTIALWPDYSSLVGTLMGNLILLSTAAAVVFVLSSLTSKKVSD